MEERDGRLLSKYRVAGAAARCVRSSASVQDAERRRHLGRGFGSSAGRVAQRSSGMSAETVEKIADAVLYEGYMLYPYRPSNVKNRQRWTFGGLYPASYAERNGDSSRLHAEVLVKPSDGLTLEIHVRFLHLMAEER